MIIILSVPYPIIVLAAGDVGAETKADTVVSRTVKAETDILSNAATNQPLPIANRPSTKNPFVV